MSRDCNHQEQDQNTGKLVMHSSAFYKVANTDGATAEEITNYLQDKFGDVWKAGALTSKAEEILKRSAVLGFLERQGSRYLANVARGCSGRSKRCKKKPCKRSYKKKQRPSGS